MSVIDRYADRLARGETLPAALDFLLRPASGAIQWGMRRRLRQPRERVSAHVVSFGALTAGGAGKTPAVIERAEREIESGRRVGILTRGYGARRAEPVISAQLNPADRYEYLGDEAALILRRVPDSIVFKNPDRTTAAKQAIDEFECNVLLLDDGYQYVMLERDENILVLDATRPFGNRRLLPRGTLREPFHAINRATALYLTRCDQAPNLDALRDELATAFPSLPVRTTRHAPTQVVHVATGACENLEWLQGREIAVACGIGNPDAFFETLSSLGAKIRERIARRDHADWGPDVIPNSSTVVTTEKDAVRFAVAPENLYALQVDLRDWPES